MKVRELLSDETKWTKEARARDAEGRATYSDAPDAVCWCLSGAISRCYTYREDRFKVRQQIQNELNYKDFWMVLEYNDAPERTFEDIKHLIEKLDI